MACPGFSLHISCRRIPLLFYSPALLPPAHHPEAVSQVDVLPTIAGLLLQPYTNSTLGRDLLDPIEKEHAAFIIYHAPGWIGVVNDDYFFRKNIRIQKEELVPVKKDSLQLTFQQRDSVRKHLSELTSAMYETSRWMLLHNHR